MKKLSDSAYDSVAYDLVKTTYLSESEAQAKELNQSQSVGTSTVIGLSFRFCFQLVSGSRKKMGRFWFFRLRFRRAYDSAYDSNFLFSLGHKRSYDFSYDSDSDSVASEYQPLGDGIKSPENCDL